MEDLHKLFVLAERCDFMLAERCDDLTKVNYPMLCEFKVDGERVLASVIGGGVKLVNRYGKDVSCLTVFHIAVCRELAAIRGSVVLDGELYGLDQQGRTVDFYEYLKVSKGNVSTALRLKPRLMVFDILRLNSHDLRPRPLKARKELLRDVLRPLPSEVIQLAEYRVVYNVQEAERMLEEAIRLGFEGVMLKAPFSPYESGRRTRSWLKVKPFKELDAVILGYRELESEKGEEGVGSLLLALNDSGRWVTIGKCDLPKDMAEWLSKLRELTIFSDRKIHYIQPRYVVTVSFQQLINSSEYSSGLALRFPRFIKFRYDKKPEECGIEQVK